MHDTTRSGWPTDEPITPVIERESQATMQSHAPPIVGSAQGTTVTRPSQGAPQATQEPPIALARAPQGVVDVTDTLVVGGRPSRPGLICPRCGIRSRISTTGIGGRREDDGPAPFRRAVVSADHRRVM